MAQETGVIDMYSFPIQGAHVVYELYDHDKEEPFYVGVTSDLLGRLASHCKRWRGIREVRWSEYETRYLAEKSEALKIAFWARRSNRLQNVVGNRA